MTRRFGMVLVLLFDLGYLAGVKIRQRWPSPRHQWR